ncbi:MAG: hypothetical protein KBG48_06640 [Kofleriaceae bacterium]|jgi:hypothetical protein|nr:hypothetical protein [Kofleriaceae bacterium]MBP9167045.1 hypothetical protein [Kofleriaceae bacterium]MBP9860241.1 hypothetical protein [Kofleriaceae bacterium]
MSLFAVFVGELVDALAPLRLAATDEGIRARLLEMLGTSVAAVDAAGLLPAMVDLAATIDDVEATLASWDTLANLRDRLTAARHLLDAIRAIRSGVAPGSFLPQLGREMLELLAARHLRLRSPLLYQAAVLLGVLRPVVLPDVYENGVRLRRFAVIERLSSTRLHGLLTDPVGALREDLGPAPLTTRAKADATADLVIERAGGFLSALGMPWRYGVGPDDETWFGSDAASVRHVLMVLAPHDLVSDAGGYGTVGACFSLSPADEADFGVVVTPLGLLDAARTVGDWDVTARMTGNVQAFAFGGGRGFDLVADTGTASVNVGFTARRAPSGVPFILGAARGTRLEFDRVSFDGSAMLSTTRRELKLGCSVERVVFVATSDGGDGFLRHVLGDGELRAMFDFGVMYSSGWGLSFEGGVGLQTRIPCRVTLGPITMDGIVVVLESAPEVVRVVVSCGVQVRLGAVLLGLEGVGSQLLVALPAEAPARDFHVDFDVRPPDGAAISIENAIVRGSGYLRCVGPRYLGGLSLEALGVSLSAFGLLDTDVPGAGYSLAAVIAAGFRPVPLPLGFTLEGVGGLIGIHRRVDTEALRGAVRTAAGMAELFFPADPMAQAERLTTELGRYFPAAEGRHVFGPAVKFGWGNPTVVRGTVAVLLELPAPARVVVLGTMTAKLPTEEQAIVDLTMDVVGEVDVGQKRAAVDASLRSSTIAGFPITGDLAARLCWGNPRSFALAIGGFHSQFRPPAEFPTLRRVRIELGSGDDPRLDAEGFLALTSNTLQMGARIDLYASAGPLNITGGLGFETLVQFSPFGLAVDVWAGVKLRRGTTTLAGVSFEGHLQGPKPWRIDGKACLSLWFVELCVPIHVTFGSGAPVAVPDRAIWPALRAAVEAPAAWAAEVPGGLTAAIVAGPEEGAGVAGPARRVDPCATLSMTQQVVPLARRITAYAQGRPTGIDRFEVTEVRVGGQAVPAAAVTPVKDWFAPAQFEAMSEADKLSRPGFEEMMAGVAVGAATVRAGTPLTRVLDYDTVVIAGGQRQTAERYRPTRALQLAGTALSATAQAPRGRGGSEAYAPPPGAAPVVTLTEATYVIATTDALTARWDLTEAASRSEAELALRAHLAAHPGDATRLQVVPSYEVAA